MTLLARNSDKLKEAKRSVEQVVRNSREVHTHVNTLLRIPTKCNATVAKKSLLPNDKDGGEHVRCAECGLQSQPSDFFFETISVTHFPAVDDPIGSNQLHMRCPSRGSEATPALTCSQNKVAQC